MKVVSKVIAAVTLLVAGHSHAADIVGVGQIQWIENGWYGEGVAFSFTVGIDGCPAARTEFAVSKDHAGYKELVSMLLAAQASSSNVTLFVEKGTCLFGGRTKVLAIRMAK